MDKVYHIYLLFDGKGVPFYVGQTTLPKQRERHHRGRYKNKKINLLTIDVAYSLTESVIREKEWIKRLCDVGVNLHNKRK